LVRPIAAAEDHAAGGARHVHASALPR
jgi:hypothetical protein